MQAWQERDFWDSCLLPRLTGALYHDFVWNFLPELFENVDLHTRIHIWFMHDSAPPYFLHAFRNSWTMCFRGNRQDEVGQNHGLLLLQIYIPYNLSLGKSNNYCLCYRSQWRLGLATTNTERIWHDSYDTWNFPASQAVTVQTCNVTFCVEDQGRHFEDFL